MAFIQMNMMSHALMRSVSVNVILPVDKIVLPGMPKREDKPYKTLYLLHGLFGNHMDWINGTSILRWAEEMNLAVIMPAGDNSFYVDQKEAHDNYGEFIGVELVELTRKMFPLSRKREDTFIAGLSMGGYGAIRNGLLHHDIFSHVAGLSSALITDNIENRTIDNPIWFEGKGYAESCFGDLSKVNVSNKSPKWIISQELDHLKKHSKFFLCCGLDDSLLEANRSLSKYMIDKGLDVIYKEGEGGHDWDFWNTYIKHVLNWLPLEDKED